MFQPYYRYANNNVIYLYATRKKSSEEKIHRSWCKNAIYEVNDGACIRKRSIQYGSDRSTEVRYMMNEQKLHKFEETTVNLKRNL